MRDRPLVSILTPSLNQARWVDDCLSSVAAQTYAHIEQVVVDGGSTDGTLDVLRRRRDPFVRIVEAAGSSQGEALNVAFEASSGEIVGWLNTDDAFFGTDAVECVVRTFAEFPEADVVYGDAVMADVDGRVLRHVSPDATLLHTAGVVSPLVQPSVFFRRAAVDGRLIADWIGVSIDYELWLRLRVTGRFVKVRRIVAIDRDHPARKSRNSDTARSRDLEEMTRRYGLRRQRRGPVATAERWHRRLDGLGEILCVEKRYSFAYPVIVDARWRRTLRQVFLPQRWCDRV